MYVTALRSYEIHCKKCWHIIHKPYIKIGEEIMCQCGEYLIIEGIS